MLETVCEVESGNGRAWVLGCDFSLDRVWCWVCRTFHADRRKVELSSCQTSEVTALLAKVHAWIFYQVKPIFFVRDALLVCSVYLEWATDAGARRAECMCRACLFEPDGRDPRCEVVESMSSWQAERWNLHALSATGSALDSDFYVA